MNDSTTNRAYIMLTPAGLAPLDHGKIPVALPGLKREWTKWQEYPYNSQLGFPVFYHIYNNTDSHVHPYEVMVEDTARASYFVHDYARRIKVRRIPQKELETMFWRDLHRPKQYDFSTAADKVSLRYMTFHGMTLLDVDFSTADLRGAVFHSCALKRAKFWGASVTLAKFQHCTMELVDFRESDLTDTVFHNCDLNGARFNRAMLKNTNFVNADNVDAYNADYVEEAHGLRRTEY